MHDGMKSEMDEKMKGEMMEEMKKLGIEEDIIDDKLLWGSKKMMLGMAKVMWSLKEHGMEESEAMEVLKKMVDSMMQKEMMDKMKMKLEEMHKDKEGKDWK